jgi:hypothetical protein
MDKVYNLPAWRSIIVGVFLVLMGLIPIWIQLSSDGLQSLPAALVNYFAGFIQFPEVIVMLILTAILVAGILYLSRANKIIRAKIDDKGFYYLPIGEGNVSRGKLLFSLFYYAQKLQFIPYADIAHAEYTTNKWLGDGVTINFTNGDKRLIMGVNVLPNHQKHDIVNTLNARIKAL